MAQTADDVPRQRGATYREVLALPEFRALYVGRLLSLIGDQMAKVALAVAVYGTSHSALLAALTFAVSFLPYLAAGPFLSTLGDRFPRRHVMVTCDLLRAALVLVLIVPGLPLWSIFVVLVLVVALASPFEASRNALMPEVLPGDAYVVGTSLGQMANQATQVAGYALGGIAVAAVHTSGALLFDAGTFVVSALMLVLWVRPGDPSHGARRGAARASQLSLLRDVRDGAVIVFTRPVLRTVVLIAWVASAFSVVPEGLAVSYAHELGRGSRATGMLVAALPLGALVGNVLLGRFVRPDRRAAWMRPLALLSVLPLAGTALHVNLPVALVLWSVAGVGGAIHLPAITTFVAFTPSTMRARAFGLADAGLQTFQGLALVVGGAIAQWLSPSLVIGLSALAGVGAVAVVSSMWPAELRARSITLPLDDAGATAPRGEGATVPAA